MAGTDTVHFDDDALRDTLLGGSVLGVAGVEYSIPHPKPGDVIELASGNRAVIDSAHFRDDFGEGPVVLAVCAYSVFRGDGSSQHNPAGMVSASGGPCPFVRINALSFVGETNLTCWKWKDRPRAGGRETYTVTVNKWKETG